ncbi:MAG: glucose-1-phosphate adenylyltransferase subunit GlgD [Aerococcus sp.]|nr:glucose-1-phosphate adenylyltransferase subunit GlgD [Aerococcus sp.]
MKKSKVCAILNLTEPDQQLQPLTAERPLAMMPFASRYRLLDFNLSNIAYAGARSAALFISRSGRSVYDHIRSGKPWNLDTYSGGIFTFSQVDHKRALYEAGSRMGAFYDDHRAFVKNSNAKYVFVAGSKVIAMVSLKEIIESLEESGLKAVRIYSRVPRSFIEYHPDERMVVLDDEGNVSDLLLEGVTPIRGNEVLYDLNMTVIESDLLLDMLDRAEAEDINDALDVVVDHYLEDYTVKGFEHKGYVANIDSIQSYFNASMTMLEAENFGELLHGTIPVLTKGQNGVPVYYARGSEVRSANIATGCEIFGQVVHSQLSRKVRVEAGASIDHSIIWQNCHIGKGATIRYAILDKNVTVEPGATLIGVPENPIIVGKGETIKA